MESLKRSCSATCIPDDIKSIPSLCAEDVQKIVNECEKADKEFETAKNSIIDLKNQIDKLFNEEIQSSNALKIRLDDTNKFKLSIGNRVLKNELKEDGTIPVISANVNEIFGKIDKELITDYSTPYVLWGIDDWMVRCIEKGKKILSTDCLDILSIDISITLYL